MEQEENYITEFKQSPQAMFSEIIIPLALPQNYTWSIPSPLQHNVQPGIRVEVELRSKKYSGIIKRIFSDKPPAFNPKEILNILDAEPLLHVQQMQLWQWIAQYYMCSEGEVMQAAIPANLKLSGESILIWNDEYGEDFSALDNDEYVIAEALHIKKELRMSEVQQLLDVNNVYPVIKRLIEKKICFVWEQLKEKFKPKTETYIHLNSFYHDEDKLSKLLNDWGKTKAPKQLELLLSFLHLIKSEGEVTQLSLLKKANATSSQLKSLIDKNILLAQKREINRIGSLPKNISVSFTLSAAQQRSLEEINEAFKTKDVCLLHGVISSGKTNVYIKLIEQYIKEGKQVLYMLPEIALTSQIIRRLQAQFGGNIAVYHSKFNANERVEIWNKIKTGETKVLLGARSALFLPFKELGLIICDEEHDASYKQQDPAPRYHARDTAIYYASLFHAKVLLGSATPSIETFYNAQTKKYAFVTLSERYGETGMPEITLIDLKAIAKTKKDKIAITPQMKEAIDKSLAEGKQIILFQNRRGYSPYVICGVCGWIPQCVNCNVTLTFHKAKNKLLCHYCGSEYPLMQTCAACGSHNFFQKNFGTEKIEEILVEQLPSAKIARMDYDSVKGKYDHDNLIKQFEQRRIDILAGTQMVVKGLDFEHVNLVGILDADALLSYSDFRVNERAFQLMEQVSGRAGRKNETGKVFIQVSNTQHPVLNFLIEHNYQHLYDFEIENRRNFFYPPFSRLIKIIFKHKENNRAEEVAGFAFQGLNVNYKKYISGPAQPVINRVRNQFIWEILLKLPKDSQIIQRCKMEIAQQIIIVQTNKRYRSVQVIVDVDCV